MKSTKKITILKPQKCKTRKELSNKLKQILNLKQTTKNRRNRPKLQYHKNKRHTNKSRRPNQERHEKHNI